MKSISVWAHHHKWAARLILIFAYLLLNIIGLFFGDILAENGTTMSVAIPYLLAVPFFSAIIFYPSRKEKAKYKNFYRRQKAMDSILATASFLMIIYTANLFALSSTIPRSATKTYAATHVSKPIKPIVALKKKVENIGFVVKHWKQIKQNYKHLKQAYKQQSTGGKVGLIILASLLAAGLLILVANLSCHLSCSGSEGAALFVLLAGTGLIILLLAIAIRAINKGKVSKENEVLPAA